MNYSGVDILDGLGFKAFQYSLNFRRVEANIAKLERSYLLKAGFVV